MYVDRSNSHIGSFKNWNDEHDIVFTLDANTINTLQNKLYKTFLWKIPLNTTSWANVATHQHLFQTFTQSSNRVKPRLDKD